MSDSDGLQHLLEMGFPEDKAKAALAESNNNVEQAMEYLVSHEDDESGDKSGSAAVKVAKSFKCVDTGKLFRTMNDAMIYAERTGNANFEECDIEVPPLTAEEKAEKVKALREKIVQRRAAREAQEKVDALEREKKRRQGGQEMAEIREEHERLRREREYEARLKEKEAFKQEREKLKRQLAMDKAERAADKARKEGRDPKAAYDEAFNRQMGIVPDDEKKTRQAKSAEETIKESVANLLEYRAGGDGVKALGILKKLLGNPLNNKDEAKYRVIKMDNETIKKKVTSLRGGPSILKAAGFKKMESERVWRLEDESYNEELLKFALEQIEQGLASA